LGLETGRSFSGNKAISLAHNQQSAVRQPDNDNCDFQHFGNDDEWPFVHDHHRKRTRHVLINILVRIRFSPSSLSSKCLLRF
jgi:hypothetical protein